MNDVLTPEQIAELVAAAKDGDVPAKPTAAATRRPRRVREIDFTRPVKLAPDQQRRFERAHETFCRTTSTRLSAELRTPFELEVINVEQLTWSVALAGVPQPSIFGIVTTQDEGSILLCVETACLFNVIERLIGGGDSDAIPARSLTEIELALTRRTFAGVVEHLSNVWQELFGLELSLVEIESQVANVLLAPPSEPTVALTIETRGGRTSSTMSLLVPHRAIATVTGRLSSHYAEAGESNGADDALDELVRTSIGAVEVDIRAEVGTIDLTIGEVLALGEGDVLRLGNAAANGVFVCADGVRLHRARPGRSGSRRAVEIVERLEETG